jgi:hypothetical protein
MEKEFLNHNHYLNFIKKMLKATFVGWETYKGSKTLKVIIDGKVFPMKLSDGDITEDTYRQLITELMTPNEKE